MSIKQKRCKILETGLKLLLKYDAISGTLGDTGLKNPESWKNLLAELELKVQDLRDRLDLVVERGSRIFQNHGFMIWHADINVLTSFKAVRYTKKALRYTTPEGCQVWPARAKCLVLLTHWQLHDCTVVTCEIKFMLFWPHPTSYTWHTGCSVWSSTRPHHLPAKLPVI